ncbi:hypothetical protein Bca4012_023893 [Brassica carinata]|uniref:Nucleotide-diphospho-sugar transferase domain-containing protein n=1 Tax=Brassica carinata TaxID=52824 RepID=A0A8X7NWC2_BRACI|nr:hypothetical protein Bca52824_089984 [Brassica carinata]
MADVQGGVSEDDDGGYIYNNPQRRERLMVGRRDLKVIAVFLTVTALMVCLLCYHYQSPIQQMPRLFGFSAFGSLPIPPKQDSNDTLTFESKDNKIDLEEVLREAATENKTVIITFLNKAWASFHVGQGTKRLLRHVVVMCLDEEAYSRCMEVHPRRCYFLKTPGVDFSGQKNYMTRDYLKMMWRRIELLGFVLKLGYSFISTDMDVMWLRDPFPRFFSEGDFQVSCDSYNGNSADKRNFVNTGFKYVQANNRTVEFYKYWYGSRWRFRGKKDQDVFNKIKYNRYITEKIRLKIKFLDTVYFRGFCQLRREMNKVCTMHANCCVGLQNKIFDLRQVLQDWKGSLSAAATDDGRKMKWRPPDHCWGRVKKSNKTRV